MDTFTRRAGCALAVPLFVAGAMACGSTQDPCANLPAPTSVERQAAEGGAEIDRIVLTPGVFGGQVEVECELINGAWVAENEVSS